MSGDLGNLIVGAVRQASALGTPAAIATALHAVRPDDLVEFFHASLAADVAADPITETKAIRAPSPLSAAVVSPASTADSA